jgi:transcriptional regulator of acetoin/glycerol metabolism
MELPIAVDDLAEAAQLLGRPLAEVQDAATRCRPYSHSDGRQFHSLSQLARALDIDIARARFQPMPEPKPEPRPQFKISREQAEEAAAAMAAGASLSRTADELGIGRQTLSRALTRHGLRTPPPSSTDSSSSEMRGT